MKMQCLILLNMLLQVTGITSGRAAALWPAGLGLISVIAGWVALTRSKCIGRGRPGAIIALFLGVIDMILSAMHLIQTSDSSIGTGSGRLGAIVALALGVIGVILGGRALARSRKAVSDND